MPSEPDFHHGLLRGRDRGQCRAAAIESEKLDLEGVSPGVDVDDRPDVSGLQLALANVAGKHDAVMFVKHGPSGADMR